MGVDVLLIIEISTHLAARRRLAQTVDLAVSALYSVKLLLLVPLEGSLALYQLLLCLFTSFLDFVQF